MLSMLLCIFYTKGNEKVKIIFDGAETILEIRIF